MPKMSKKTKNGKSRKLPDPSTWHPRDTSENLSAAFSVECKGAEERLLYALGHEKKFAVDSFDSGLPFEHLVRHEIERLLPKRYSVTSGHVLDSKGKSAGLCDIVVFNDYWFSPIKGTASPGKGFPFLPIEGVYAVGEVKQTLSSETLDAAMEKLVKCQRLYRPKTFAHRIVENRESAPCPHGLTNPLFSFILASSIAPNETFEKLVDRFFDVSTQLKRLEVVRALCVLDRGTVSWAYRDLEGRITPALFVEKDLFHPIFPTLSSANIRSPFLLLIQILNQSLYHTVLAPEDIAFAYGLDSTDIKIPKDPSLQLPVEKEWLDLLSVPCKRTHA